MNFLLPLHAESIRAIPENLALHLIAWQQNHGRSGLPWQSAEGEVPDPYRVWLSEIMLQQTQVVTVIPYYQRFLQRFPDVGTLARVPLSDVLEVWAGLGYYSRARNLHACAVRIVADYEGVFPSSPEDLEKLPGIGRSTAAAIAAFAFGRPFAILDGNVKRVLCRFFGIDVYPGTAAVERNLWDLAQKLVDPLVEAFPDHGALHQALSIYTQGIMDLGALICTRKRPLCIECPWHVGCQACREGIQHILPVPKPVRARPERSRALLFLFDSECDMWFERRPPRGLWGGLLTPMELDMEEGAREEIDRARIAAHLKQAGFLLLEARALAPCRHDFSHFRLLMFPWICRVQPSVISPHVSEVSLERVERSDVVRAALPAPVRSLIQGIFSGENEPQFQVSA